MSAHTLAGLAVFSECEAVRALAIPVVIFLVARALPDALALEADNPVAETFFEGKHEAIFAPASDYAVVDFLAWVVPLLADILSCLGLISVLGACVREVKVLVPLKSERAVVVSPSTRPLFSASSRTWSMFWFITYATQRAPLSTPTLHCGSQQRKPKDVLCMVSTRTCFNCARGIVAWFLFEVV